MWPVVNQFGKAVGAVGNYLGNIGQNIHDVGTAAGTSFKVGTTKGALKTVYQNDPVNKAAGNNFTTQIKEVGGALLGDPGTRSDQYSKEKGYVPAVQKVKPKP